MVVAEQGAYHLGETLQLTVTSVLQTSAGRMIFGRIDTVQGKAAGGHFRFRFPKRPPARNPGPRPRSAFVEGLCISFRRVQARSATTSASRILFPLPRGRGVGSGDSTSDCYSFNGTGARARLRAGSCRCDCRPNRPTDVRMGVSRCG